MLSLSFDAARGVVTATVRGSPSPADVQRYSLEATTLFPIARARSGQLRLLIDNSAVDLPAPEIIAQLRALGDRIGRPDDRVATVVRSSLMKLHAKQQIPAQMHNVFVSRNAALTWLTAHDVAPAAAPGMPTPA